MKLKTKLFSTVIAMSMVLTACGQNNEQPADDAAETAPATEEAATEETSEENTDAAKDSESSMGAISLVSREDGSGTRGAFTELVGLVEKTDDGEEDLTSTEANVQNTTNGVMTIVAQDKGAIGYISLGSLNDTVKAVKVDGVEATEATVESGEYSLFRPFNLAYKEDAITDLGKDFLKFIASPDGQAIVSENGYVKIKEGEAYEASGMSGDLKIAGSTSVSPLMEKLIEAYKGLNPDVNIEMQSIGSTEGINTTLDGASEIAMASRELKDEEKEQLTPVVIANDGIAVIVNKENPIEELTSEQIQKMFKGEIADWSELN
ncbi:substrate-binding domain-containing protein [Anaerococcus sp. AGMB09787]|uniref:substrate-binding domain-containing protein n=1 Tax=Anaerococcus sp. AGMB09787 TaxID=2922869 RepID=UPI001FAF38D1|nr:substrate-binding domain-containing protein [Anaerococcus sp. AGMB09787]